MLSWQNNSKATKVLRYLADLDLISKMQNSEYRFLKVVARLHERSSSNPPSLEEITKEVELVRAKIDAADSW